MKLNLIKSFSTKVEFVMLLSILNEKDKYLGESRTGLTSF